MQIYPDIDLVQRLSKLETEFHDFKTEMTVVVPAIAVFVLLLAGFTWKDILKRAKAFVEKSAINTAKKEIEAAALGAKNSLLEIEGAKIKALEALEKIAAPAGIAGIDSSVTRLMVDQGEFAVNFAGKNYQQGTETFKQAFVSVPNIFLGERVAGAWIFVKIDEKNAKEFKWAARTLDGEATQHSTTIQWFAVATILEKSPKVTPTISAQS